MEGWGDEGVGGLQVGYGGYGTARTDGILGSSSKLTGRLFRGFGVRERAHFHPVGQPPGGGGATGQRGRRQRRRRRREERNTREVKREKDNS